MTKEEKLEIIIKQIDITDTLFNNAEEKYNNVAKYLEKFFPNIKLYPQGSFSIGTTTKPYKNEKDCFYDIDIIAEVEDLSSDISGEELMRKVHNILLDSIYEDKITPCEKCITLSFAEVDGVGFNIDIVPAKKSEDSIKSNMICNGVKEEYIDDIISISSSAKSDDENNGWYVSMPSSYKKWFEDINDVFKQRRLKKLNESGMYYASIDKVPRYKMKTSLQKVIQILKRSRDVYYSHINKDDYKPISAIISTIVAVIASEHSQEEISTYDLLLIVLKELKKYSYFKQVNNLYEYNDCYSGVPQIYRENGEWKMINPVNPSDNYLDSWNKEKSENTAKLFFDWIDFLEKDFKGLIDENDSVFYNHFGKKLVERAFDLESRTSITNGPKPYGK